MKFNSCFSKCFSFPSETAIIDIRKEEPEPENDKNFTVFSYSELKVATHGFSASNKIGEGRENLSAAKKEFNKTEDYLKSLQSVGQIIGEVLRPPDNERCIWCKKHPPEMPHRTRPMTALLVFTGLNAVLVSTITPVYDFVCFLPFWERRDSKTVIYWFSQFGVVLLAGVWIWFWF
ncbi:hypothetical protein J1N35_003014 [Gossypium stocksii]|uniref:Uncharacterized protein n=2 Tax=Gossypium TaxID=3633 RepID=A0A9D3WMX7_9ROSI|nr:hypothetical protein J1N35_003014 [Gossypium stocksii]